MRVNSNPHASSEERGARTENGLSERGRIEDPAARDPGSQNNEPQRRQTMRKCFALMAVLVLAGSATATLAKEDGKLLPVNRADELGATNDRSLGAIQGHQRGGVVDTASYGDIGAGGFSIFDDVWDWDNPSGGGGALMGWYSTDVTQQSQAYGRRITQSIWNGH